MKEHPSEAMRRHAAILATRARFETLPLVWGKADCIHMAALTIARLGLAPSLAKFGSYTSPATALRRLRAQGHDDVPAAIDAVHGLDQRPFAFALPADIVAVPSPFEAFPALGVFLGGPAHDKYLGFDTIEPFLCRPMQLLAPPLVCWKVTPCLKR